MRMAFHSTVGIDGVVVDDSQKQDVQQWWMSWNLETF
jgi:hypothetical protein